MPVTRITVGEHYTDTQLGEISSALHQSLTEEFSVPLNDCFQIFERLPACQRVFDRHYQSGKRSDNFVLFQITAGKPRTVAQKQNFYRALSQRLFSALAIHPDDVMVIIQFNTAEDWSFSNGEIYCPEAL
ncbi:tautomerase family protein [Klebsiella sp. BIGb0407]|uniref:tautomerase family protein n=1 Tax=Klebsiella sp. BIGb0407 TaxID=2940603 RepID=UPI00216757EA|nr:tautomerase family protein [Klebsiella sp. BIGb0407]MCS3432404.1 phenylpyruvate tautomerase PptA (4-oxalocrotonate tautomerase family) [Klebsiella sp. BIGb0407]